MMRIAVVQWKPALLEAEEAQVSGDELGEAAKE
jgi:hypothetical protein